jgi:hypothetical protein
MLAHITALPHHADDIGTLQLVLVMLPVWLAWLAHKLKG